MSEIPTITVPNYVFKKPITHFQIEFTLDSFINVRYTNDETKEEKVLTFTHEEMFSIFEKLKGL